MCVRKLRLYTSRVCFVNVYLFKLPFKLVGKLKLIDVYMMHFNLGDIQMNQIISKKLNSRPPYYKDIHSLQPYNSETKC